MFQTLSTKNFRFNIMNIIFLLVTAWLPVVVWSKEQFIAAVFEHRPRFFGNDYSKPKEIIASNMYYYRKAAALAADKKADIIIFNEFGLFPYPGTRENFRKFAENILDPQHGKYIPCLSESKEHYILPALSCMARDNNIYVVANMGDAQTCDGFCDIQEDSDDCQDECPEDGVLLYNTNVVFDREGKLVARYHKNHPYFEVVDIPDPPDFVTFNTEFGKFGLIICFDSVFEESVILARNYDIDTVIFPTHWFEDILPLNTVEFQQSWALANGVNFVAANTQTPGLGSLGSGIYSKDKGALVYTFEPSGESKLLVAKLGTKGTPTPHYKPQRLIVKADKVVSEEEETGDKFPDNGFVDVVGKANDLAKEYRYFKSQTGNNYTLVKITKSRDTALACQGDLCCSLSYSADNIVDDYYLAAFNGLNQVYNGINGLTHYNWREQTCLLVRCDSNDDKPCVVQPPTAKTVFKEVVLKAEFLDGVVYPTVSYEKFRLVPVSEFKVHKDKSQTVLTFSSSSTKPLLKVGLMARIYKEDPPFIPYNKPE